MKWDKAFKGVARDLLIVAGIIFAIGVSVAFWVGGLV